MANVQRLSKSVIRDLRERGRLSLFFFVRALWGDRDLTPDVHQDLCNFLQGASPHEPWTRALVCAWRGSLKSSCVRGWIAWKGLYGPAAGLPPEDVRRYVSQHELGGIRVEAGVCIPDWSSLLVAQRYANAEAHLEMIEAKFQWGRQAGLLQDMYRDRLPEGFAGWNKGKMAFLRNDPNAEPTVSAAGLDSKLESTHRDAIVGDDLEGADADKSDVPNEDSFTFVTQRAEPLLKNPSTGQVLVVGTPHGAKPLVHQIRKMEAGGSLDNSQRLTWKLWWKAVVDDAGKLRWPKRNEPEWWAGKQELAKHSREARRLLDMQYLLREETEAGRLFDMQMAERTAFTFEAGFRMRYLANAWHQQRVDEGGMLVGVPEWRVTDISQCRAFMHLDPKHRDKGDTKPGVRPSLAAIVVTLVSPDLHIFEAEHWIKEAGLDEFTEAFFLLYRKWAPYRFTVDTIGAQIWFKNWLKALETTKYRGLMSLPRPWRPSRRLPLPSSLMVESQKGLQSKEEWVVQQLELPLNLGFLHLNAGLRFGGQLWQQMEAFPSATVASDGPDALAQGSLVWHSFLGPKDVAALRAKAEMIRQYRGGPDPLTGYQRSFPEGEQRRVYTGPTLGYGPN